MKVRDRLHCALALVLVSRRTRDLCAEGSLARGELRVLSLPPAPPPSFPGGLNTSGLAGVLGECRVTVHKEKLIKLKISSLFMIG